MNRKAMSMALTLVITIVVLIVIALALITVTTENVAQTGASAEEQTLDSFCKICTKNMCGSKEAGAEVDDIECPCLGAGITYTCPTP